MKKTAVLQKITNSRYNNSTNSRQLKTLPAVPVFQNLTDQATSDSRPIQRVIDVTYAQYLAESTAGLSQKNGIKSYMRNFVTFDYNLASDYRNPDLGDPDIETNYKDIFSKLNTGDIAGAALVVPTLVTDINTILNRAALSNHEHKYNREDSTSWTDHPTALKKFEEIVASSAPGSINARIMNAGAPDALKVVNFTDIRTSIPRPLAALLVDIYFKLKAGGILDSRSGAEQTARSITVDKPGAIRSWHEDSRGKLPANNYVNPASIPATKTALHTHYTTTSNTGGGAGAGAAVAPRGFIEYTGTGIAGDQHNSKIIFDYINNHIYLTLSHYQYWGKTAGGYQNLSQAAEVATAAQKETFNGAYTKIVMDI